MTARLARQLEQRQRRRVCQRFVTGVNHRLNRCRQVGGAKDELVMVGAVPLGNGARIARFREVRLVEANRKRS